MMIRRIIICVLYLIAIAIVIIKIMIIIIIILIIIMIIIISRNTNNNSDTHKNKNNNDTNTNTNNNNENNNSPDALVQGVRDPQYIISQLLRLDSELAQKLKGTTSTANITPVKWGVEGKSQKGRCPSELLGSSESLGRLNGYLLWSSWGPPCRSPGRLSVSSRPPEPQDSMPRALSDSFHRF